MRMKIIVFVKQVPDTDDVKLDPKTGNLCREGVKSMLNPLDANAVESALAMGCDEAYLLSDRAFGGADTLATSYVLSKAAEKIGGFDLLIFGRHAVDGDTAQTGPATAAFLDIPQVTLVSALEVEDGWARCERELGSVRQTVRVKLPAAVTVCGSINKPRYATPINIMRALKKPRTTWNAADLGCDTSRTGVPGSPSCTKRVFEPEKLSADTTYLSGSPSDMAKALVEALRDRHLI